MKHFVFIDIIETIYVIYMYNYFKTSKSFHNPLEIIIQNKNISQYLKHPVNNGIFESKICQLGNLVSILLGLWVFLRPKKKKFLK